MERRWRIVPRRVPRLGEDQILDRHELQATVGVRLVDQDRGLEEVDMGGHLGLLDEAREFLEVRSRMTPPLQLSAIRKNLAGFAHLDVFVDGLVRAGVPE